MSDSTAAEQPADLIERVRRLEEAMTRVEAQLGQHSTSTSTSTSAYRSPPAPASPAASAQPDSPARDIESEVGAYWLARAGIVALITGLAYLITVHFGDLGVAARVALGYLLAGALGGFGLWMSKRYPVFGQVIFGGGLAVAYFVTYALHFVPAVRILDNEAATLLLLVAVVLAIVGAAQALRSETVAGVALFLGFHTSTLSESSALTLVATSLLAGGGVFFLLKNRWVIVPLSSMVAVYTSHFAWVGRAGTPAAELSFTLGFLVLYFVVFNVALLARPSGLSPTSMLAFVGINGVAFVALGAREMLRLDARDLPLFFVATTIALSGAAGFAAKKQANLLRDVYAGAALITAALAAQERLDGDARLVTWSVLGAIAVGLARWFDARWLGVLAFSILVAALVGCFAFHDEIVLGPIALGGSFLLLERVHHPLGPPWLLRTGSSCGIATVLLLGMASMLPSNLSTLAWGLAGFLTVGLGFVVRERIVRLVGLAVLVLAIGRLMLFDLGGLATDQRILTFLLLGVALLALSFAYTRMREQVRRWL